MKIWFFWTWEFSKNILEKINKKLQVKIIISQPDKAVWRKKIIIPTQTKKFWLQNNIEVLQPEKLKNNEDLITKLKSLDLDFLVVVAYWKIIPLEILQIPKFWSINIHGSILPKYRWASPIQEAVKNWDEKTWVTIMYMSAWMDEWDILNCEKVKIQKYDKTQEIFEKFENIAPDLLIETLEKIISNEITWKKQDEKEATYCSKIEKKDWEIDWSSETAKQIFDKFKAYNIWPGVFTYYNQKKLNIEDCDYTDENRNEEVWKIIRLENKNIWVICKNWILILKKVKLEWKKEMDINTFINGNKNFLEYNFLIKC